MITQCYSPDYSHNNLDHRVHALIESVIKTSTEGVPSTSHSHTIEATHSAINTGHAKL